MADVQAALDAVVAAVRLGDRAGYDAYLADPHSVFADRLFANLTTLPPTDLELRAEARTAELSAAQSAGLPGGWVQQVRASSRLEHDAGPASYRVWLVVVPAHGGVRLAGLAEDPAGAAPSRPLWLVQRVRLVTGHHATVMAGGRADLIGWLHRAQNAEQTVRKRLERASTGRWTSGLVLELPSTERAFEQILGVERDSYHRIAAVAWPEGADPTSDAVRVVVNPAAAASLDAERLEVLLAHEATHVLTRSASSPAPMWLVEGFADWVAFDAVPAAAPPTAKLVLTDVRRHGAPRNVPPDAEFRPDSDDLDLTYGRAWLLCRFIADTWSDTDLVRLYAEIDGGSGVSAALAAVLGVDEQTLLRRWQSWLEREARRSAMPRR